MIDVDREIGDYEVPKDVVKQIFESPTSILLVRRDDYFPEDLSDPQYPANFQNNHTKELDRFFEGKGLRRSGFKEVLYKYRDRNNPRILYGSAVYAESSPFDVTPYITIQSVGLNGNSPVYILGPIDTSVNSTHGYNLSINGDKETEVFETNVSPSQIEGMIKKIHINTQIGKKEFPNEDVDPFLLLAKEISRINRRDFSGY